MIQKVILQALDVVDHDENLVLVVEIFHFGGDGVIRFVFGDDDEGVVFGQDVFNDKEIFDDFV